MRISAAPSLTVATRKIWLGLALAMLMTAARGTARAQATAPANDSFSSASGLSGYDGIITGSTVNASTEPGEPAGPLHTVWYTWTAPAAGAVAMSTLGSNFYTSLAVYKGASLNGLQLVAGNNGINNLPGAIPYPYNASSQLSFVAVQGVTYHFAIGGIDQATPVVHTLQGKFILSWTYGAIAGTFTPPAPNGTLVAGLGSIYATEGDTGVNVPVFRLNGSTGAATATVAFNGINTSVTDFTPVTTSLAFSAGQLAAFATFDTAQNTVSEPDRAIRMSVTSTTPAVPVLDLSASLLAEPAAVIRDDEHPVNDNFINETTLSGAQGSQPFTNQGASTELGTEPVYKYGAQHSVWYKWVAPQDGVVIFRGNLAGSSVGGAALFTGGTLATLAPVTAGFSVLNTSAGYASRLREGIWRVTADTTYHLVMDDVDGNETTTAGTVNWSMTDTGAAQFSTDSALVFDTVGQARLTVTRAGGSAPATLSYTLSDGSATAGEDYDGTPGTVSFDDGEVSKDIFIPVTTHPGQTDISRTFQVTLSLNPASPYAAIGAQSTATVTITSNDLLADSYALTSGSTGLIEGSTAGSSVNQEGGDNGEPAHGSPASSTSVWYQWTAANSGPMSFGCDTQFLEVYTREPVVLVPVAATVYNATDTSVISMPAGPAYRCNFTAVADATYYIAVSSPGIAPGLFHL
ncbi:MAG: hypothetical protein JWO94_2806, partial [Verrucomicrobiaceae bacterium]|nr:hypothetical protein [Verrucomicrobiaceae bacterium]